MDSAAGTAAAGILAAKEDAPAASQLLEDYAATLGRAIESSWSTQRFHVGAFPEISTRYLTEVEVPAALDAAAILRSVATSHHLVKQEDPRATFGRPPITLWRSRDFFVSAIFWLDGTTAVHQHGFSGAFRVLAGGSLHAPYTFDPGEEITHRLVLGDLHLDGPELLRVGDVRPIEPGRRFIHGLFHLDRPSVTIVVRTYGQPTGEPQFNYLRPGIGFDPFYQDALLERRFQSVITLAQLDPDAGASTACELIAGEDLWAGFLLALRWFDAVDRAGGLERLLTALARRHGAVTRPLVDTFNHQRRALSIASRRRLVHDPEHRLFLALLLNLPDRRSVDTILAQRFPGSDAGALLSRWVSELAAPEQRGVSGLDLDDAAMAALTKALRAGQTGQLGAIDLEGPPPSLLEDLFRA